VTLYRTDKDGAHWEWVHGRACWVPSYGPPAPAPAPEKVAAAELPTLSYEDWMRQYRREEREIVMPVSEYSTWK
jgi:hypothetical protein